eukprot:SAG11_NODE_134_length_15338_cov_3.876435_13_plen_239_part_00
MEIVTFERGHDAEAEGLHRAGSDREDGVRTLQATLKHPIHPGDDSGWGAGVIMSDHVGAYAWGRTHDSEGPFVVCVDEGSTGLPGSVIGYCDISIVMALGLKLNTRHRVKVKTAGADGKECVHMTYGYVRANFTVARQPLGMQTYFVNRLPGSTGLILGMNEKRRLNIDTVCLPHRQPGPARPSFGQCVCGLVVAVAFSVRAVGERGHNTVGSELWFEGGRLIYSFEDGHVCGISSVI